MRLSDIPVSEQIIEEFKLSLRTKNVPHANLLIGGQGSSQLHLALAVSRSILCAAPIEGVACENCPSCKKVDKLAHPDLHFSYPLNSSTEDGESKIGEWREMVMENTFSDLSDWIGKLSAENSVLKIHAKECSRIERTLSLKSFEGRGKVLIIWLPEFLGKEGNKLLKIIEEPPKGTYIFLVSANETPILPTIVSRCRVYRIPNANIKQLAEWLCNHCGVEEGEALNAAALSEGIVNQALANLNENQANIDIEFLNWTRIAFKRNPMETIEFVEGFHKIGDKEKVRNLIRFGIFYFNQLIKNKYRGKIEGMNTEVTQSIEKLSKILGIEGVEKIITLFEKFLFQVDRFANTKILLTQATIQLGAVLRNSLSEDQKRA